MMLQIGTETWKILRAAKRAQPGAATGRDLRLIPSRKTKDGTFLDDLVEKGFLKVQSGTVPAASDDEPTQFRQKYALTTLGEEAAEHGEYEVAFAGATADTPISGVMAELLKAREAAKAPVEKTPEPAP